PIFDRQFGRAVDRLELLRLGGAAGADQDQLFFGEARRAFHLQGVFAGGDRRGQLRLQDVVFAGQVGGRFEDQRRAVGGREGAARDVGIADQPARVPGGTIRFAAVEVGRPEGRHEGGDAAPHVVGVEVRFAFDGG